MLKRAPFEKYLPVINLYGKRQPPIHPPFSMELLSERAWRESAAWPGKRANLRLLELSGEAWQNRDALPGQMPFKPRLLMLDYEIRFRDAGADKWIKIHSEKEQVALEQARAPYKALKEELEALRLELIKQGKDLSAEQKDQLGGANDRIKELSDKGTGFGHTFWNLYKCDAEGFKYGLSTPNIPIAFVSKESIGIDRAITLRIERKQPTDRQADHELTFKFTNGNTQYALVFHNESSVEWRHYRNMSGKARSKIEKELAEIVETGRLTGDDKEVLAGYSREIDKIQRQAKLDGRGASKLTDEEKLRIKTLRDASRELEDAKRGLSGENEKRHAELREKLYYDKGTPVNLQEDTKSLYNREFDVTIMFHRKGFVSIRMDKNEPFIWENKAITKLRGYNRMLPADAKIAIESTGGAWGVCLGRPDFKQAGLLWTADMTPGLTIDANELAWLFDCEFIETSVDDTGKFTGIGPYGQKVTAKVVQVVEGKTAAQNRGAAGVGTGTAKPPRYQLQMELNPDPAGVYSPEIYFINFQVLAGAVPPRPGVAWSSLPSGNRDDKHRVKEASCTEEDSGSLLAEAVIHDPPGEAEPLPEDIAGREASMSLIRMSDGMTYSLIGQGIAKRAERQNLRGMMRVAGLLRFRRRLGTTAMVSMTGIEEVLDRPINYVVYGNGKFPNDFLRELCRNAGLRPDEYPGIAAGDIGIARFKPPAAGEPPDIVPNTGAQYWEYMQSVVKKHCPGWKLVSRNIGLVLERDVYRDRTQEFHYQYQLAANDPFVMRSLQVYQDLAEFYTEVTFTGAVNPQTGRRWTAKEQLFEATDPQFEGVSLLYTGTPIPYIADIDDSLSSFADCVLAARRFTQKHFLPPWYAKWECAFNPTLRTGDIVLANTIRVVVENIHRSTIGEEEEKPPLMVVTARFMDDVPLSVLPESL